MSNRSTKPYLREEPTATVGTVVDFDQHFFWRQRDELPPVGVRHQGLKFQILCFRFESLACFVPANSSIVHT